MFSYGAMKKDIKSYSHVFSKNGSIYKAIFNDQRFNDILTNDIVSFEELGPELFGKEKKYLI